MSMNMNMRRARAHTHNASTPSDLKRRPLQQVPRRRLIEQYAILREHRRVVDGSSSGADALSHLEVGALDLSGLRAGGSVAGVGCGLAAGGRGVVAVVERCGVRFGLAARAHSTRTGQRARGCKE